MFGRGGTGGMQLAKEMPGNIFYIHQYTFHSGRMEPLHRYLMRLDRKKKGKCGCVCVEGKRMGESFIA